MLLAAAVVAAAWADKEFDKLKGQYDEALARWSEARKSRAGAAEPPGSTKLSHPDREFYPRFKAYAEKRAGKPAALPALTWQLDSLGWMTEDEQRTEVRWIVQRLQKDHAADPAIKDALDSLGWLNELAGRDVVIPLCERVIAKNKDKDVRATAALNIGRAHYTPPRGSDAGPADDTRRARELFGQVLRDYAGTQAAERAAGYVFEIEHLQLGMNAPEFTGTDANEQDIKLADFRGRVVVVDFWGFW